MNVFEGKNRIIVLALVVLLLAVGLFAYLNLSDKGSIKINKDGSVEKKLPKLSKEDKVMLSQIAGVEAYVFGDSVDVVSAEPYQSVFTGNKLGEIPPENTVAKADSLGGSVMFITSKSPADVYEEYVEYFRALKASMNEGNTDSSVYNLFASHKGSTLNITITPEKELTSRVSIEYTKTQ